MKFLPIKEKYVSIFGRAGCLIVESFVYKNDKHMIINNMDENVIITMTEKEFFKIVTSLNFDLSDFIESFSHSGLCSNSILACRPEFAFILKLKKIFPPNIKL